MASEPAHAVSSAPILPGRVVGFAVRGDSKVRPATLGYLARVEIGELIGPDDLPRIEQALTSSGLFETVSVTIEPAPGEPVPEPAPGEPAPGEPAPGEPAPGEPGAPRGVTLVATVVDKLSWIVAPTAFALPGNLAFGAGYAENNFRGKNQKYLLYGQVGTTSSLFFGTFLDPRVRGSKLTWRTDVYLYRRVTREYDNPPDDPRSTAIGRTTTVTYLGTGALIGWNFLWWLVGDVRLRTARVSYDDVTDAAGQPAPAPDRNGWDVTLQFRLTMDRRHHRHGVTWGSYLQLHIEPSIPGIDSYGAYQYGLLRAYHSWRFFEEHELQLRGTLAAGRHLPFHEEITLGGVSDLRGYNVDQFRGDARAVFRAEYSVPLFKWRIFAFRALGFYDTGYVGFHTRRSERAYLPNQLGDGYTRSDVGGGIRVYVNNVVLPLLGLDLGYGLEGRSTEVYFEVGLTDF